jgi:fibronectin type 3 domain-containing protein
VRRELNRTVLMGEDINVVTWQNNPSNPGQKIANYNVYYQPSGGLFSGPQSPIEGENTYWHRNVDKTQTYDYFVCAVTTRGVEGEPSIRTIQGETGDETPDQTRSTTAEQDITSNKAREVIPIMIGPSEKEADEERAKNILKPLNFAAQRAFDTTTPEGRYVNILSWQPNPENQNVDQYRIYAVEEEGRRLLAELEGDAYEFIHKEIEMNKTYRYALVAVDKEKRECQPVYTEIK